MDEIKNNNIDWVDKNVFHLYGILVFTIISFIFEGAMISDNLIKESNNLTHHALESFINELTQNPSVYKYSEMFSHPQIKTISEGYSQLLKLFCYGTLDYHKTKYKGEKLNAKQIDQLKRLTILSLFEGRQVMLPSCRSSD